MYMYQVINDIVNQIKVTEKTDGSHGWDVQEKSNVTWGTKDTPLLECDQPIKIGESRYIPISKTVFEVVKLMEKRFCKLSKEETLDHPRLFLKFKASKFDAFDAIRLLDLRSFLSTNQVLYDAKYIYYPVNKLKFLT